MSPPSAMSMARAKDLPPGAAQTSSTRACRSGAAARDTSRAAASCTVQRPSVKAGSFSKSPVPVTVKQPSSHGWGVTSAPAASSS